MSTSQDTLEQILADCAHAKGDSLAKVRALVGVIRPRNANNSEIPVRNLRAVCHLLGRDDALRKGVRATIIDVFVNRHGLSLYTDSGLYTNHGFFSEVSRRIGRTWLPDLVDAKSVGGALSVIFDRSSDARWMLAIDETVWLELFTALDFDDLSPRAGITWAHELIDALRVISYRIAATGLEQEMLRVDNSLDSRQSPFLAQNCEFLKLHENWTAWLEGVAEEILPEEHLEALFEQCYQMIGKVRERASSAGASMSLTLHMKRLQQNLTRAEDIVAILSAWHEQLKLTAAAPAIVRLCKVLVIDECRKNDLGSYWHDSVELLSLRVTDNAGHAGEHYITETRSEYFEMFRSAAIAGFFIAFMALNKLFIGSEPLPPMIEGLSVCLNYGLGFVLIHLFHGTVATKQPAMTAAVIAAALEERRDASHRARNRSTKKLVELVARTSRSQLVAIAGNVLVALPMAMLIGYALTMNLSTPFPTPEKAAYLLHQAYPFTGTIIYAAIAGICLFLSGLISGYYDNTATYNQVPQRLYSLKWPRRLFGDQRMKSVVGYIEKNLGALAGNFFFGFMLGGIPTLGVLFGLPLDIRHIAFSSAFVGYSINTFGYVLPAADLAVAAAGIACIGAANLLVSFNLSLMVACRSREVSLVEQKNIRSSIWRHFREHPRDFFFPPRAAKAAAGKSEKPHNGV